MIITVPKWKIDAHLSTGQVHTIYLYDAHLSNVLRTVASIEFVPFPDTVERMEIGPAPTPSSELARGGRVTRSEG